MKKTSPKPLFDNLTWLSDPMTNEIKEHLDALNLNNALREYELAKRFLLSYSGSDDTFNSYRREIERLYQWAWINKSKSIKDLDRHDLDEYFQFVQNPPEAWVGKKHAQRFKTDEHGKRVCVPEWRPFLIRKNTKKTSQEGLSQASIRSVIAGTSTFFTYLQQENYILSNPVLLIRQKSKYIQKTQQARITRKLNDIQWGVLITQIREKCEKDTEAERLLFIFSAFYLLGLRISELGDLNDRKTMMGDFYQDSIGNWWFKTIGKGNKAREVAVSDDMIKALKRYRRYLGLSELPLPGELTPLLPKKRGIGGIGIRQLRKIVQSGFDMGVEELVRKGKEQEAEVMKTATVHWLRHTSISKDVQMRPREHVRDDAGHQSIQITDRYIEIDLEERHASARLKKIDI
ncbi:MAG: tyrosine-type recombinase/integrase [Pseudomonadota bacterium]|nr:tyrosine-type recombinase/integrase [Pseudomonadota bacterium]